MLFEYILKKNGISPVDDLTILQNVDFGSTAAAFTSGIADYTVELSLLQRSLNSRRKAM